MTESQYQEHVTQIEEHLRAVDDGEIPARQIPQYLCCALGELLAIVQHQRAITQEIITTLKQIARIEEQQEQHD